MQGQGGIQNQSQVYNQLQGVANGTGPNPAQAALNQATGQNVANQASLMAGQRGASSNVGLLARQAGQQGAATQQQAVGQGAALQAQQSLGALGQAGALANTQAGQQIGATGQLNQAALQEQQLQNQALANFNNAQISNQNSVNSANSSLANTRASQQPSALGKVAGAVGSVIGLADGGEAPAQPAAAPADPASYQQAPEHAVPMQSEPKSMAGKFFKGLLGDASSNQAPMDASGKLLQALGGETDVGSRLKQGGKVPGKPKVGGTVNSYDNDTIDAKLSPGEIVLPRSVTKSSDPVGGAAKFVQAVLEKKKREGK